MAVDTERTDRDGADADLDDFVQHEELFFEECDKMVGDLSRLVGVLAALGSEDLLSMPLVRVEKIRNRIAALQAELGKFSASLSVTADLGRQAAGSLPNASGTAHSAFIHRDTAR